MKCGEPDGAIQSREPATTAGNQPAQTGVGKSGPQALEVGAAKRRKKHPVQRRWPAEAASQAVDQLIDPILFFDLQVQAAALPGPLERLLQRRNTLPPELTGIPSPGIQPEDAGQARASNLPLAVGRSIQGGVVQQDGDIVGGKPEIGLDPIAAEVYGRLKGCQGVFGGQGAGAPVAEALEPGQTASITSRSVLFRSW